MNIDTKQYKDNLAKLVTGVCLISVRVGDEIKALTVSSVVSVSLEPEVVSFCLKTKADSFAYFQEESFFTINILSEDQEKFALNGTMKGGWAVDPNLVKCTDEFASIQGCLSNIFCKTYQIFPVGDHSIITGRVMGFGALNDSYPLSYFNRDFRKVSR